MVEKLLCGLKNGSGGGEWIGLFSVIRSLG